MNGKRMERGVYAALLAPRTDSGAFEEHGFGRQVQALAATELAGFAVNGATGEFPLASVDDLKVQLRSVRSVAPERKLLAGVGTGDTAGAVLRARIAADEGADAVLLPMPAFYPYRQDDLRSFVLTVADASPIPVLLYNLPQFTSGLNADTVLNLLREHDNILGIKDSSGSLEILQAITDAELPAARIVGNDAALHPALERHLADAVISGVACALPELMVRAFRGESGNGDLTSTQELLDEVLAQLAPLPTPWGLKTASEVRGFTRASYPLPLSEERSNEMTTLRAWLQERLPDLV